MKRIILLITLIAITSCATPAPAETITAGQWLRDLSQDHKLDIAADDMELGFLTMDAGLKRKLQSMSPQHKLLAMKVLLTTAVLCVDKEAIYFRSTFEINPIVTVCVAKVLE